MGIGERACMSREISPARLRARRAVVVPGVKRARPLDRLILPGKKEKGWKSDLVSETFYEKNMSRTVFTK